MTDSTGGGAHTSAPAPPEQPAPRSRAAPTGARVQVEPPPPEASSRSIQTVMLGLGTLVLGIAAVVIVGVLSGLDPWSRLVILLAVALVALAAPLPIAHRGLTATAEAIAVVGLVLICVAGYALWSTGTVVALPGYAYAGLMAAATAGIGYGHHRLSRLAVPRYAGLLLSQPVLPLLAYDLVTRPSEWALVFTLVAAQNAVLGHRDLQLALAPSRRWLRYLAWALHGAALAVAAGYAVTGLVAGQTVGAAVRAAAALLLVTGVGLVGAVTLRRAPLPEIAAGALTLALIGGAGRVLAVALPGHELLPVTAVVALTGAGLMLLPERARRGPALGVAVSGGVLGVIVTVLAVRAGIATVTAVLPPWSSDLSRYGEILAGSVGGTGWQLPTATAALTIVSATAVPRSARREAVVVAATLTALAAPAGLGLGPMLTPWVLVTAAAGVGVTGLDVSTRRAAAVHLAATGVLLVAASGASLATPMLTATILSAVTISTTIVAWGRPRDEAARPLVEWSAGIAILSLPIAAATGAATVPLDSDGVLAATFAAVCVSLGYAALTQLARGAAPPPVAVCAGLAAVVVAAAAFTVPEVPMADRGIAALLAISAALIAVAPRIEEHRPAIWRYGGADIAAAALTASVVATLARLSTLLLSIDNSQSVLAVGAALVLLIALGLLALPAPWRRGPVLGLGLVGTLIALVAGLVAVISGARTLTAVWATDAAAWPPDPAVAGITWAAPFALASLAVAAALVLPRPGRYGTAALLTVLATVCLPAAVGVAWWAPVAVSLVVATGYALAIPLPRNPAAAAPAHAAAAAALALYALATTAHRPGVTAAALAVIIAVGTAVAALIAVQSRADAGRRRIGGMAVTGTLLAVPGALAALSQHLAHPTDIRLAAALAGSSLGLALVASLRNRIIPYLPYATFGIVAGATATALLALPTPYPAGVYAAAAVLLAVLAELVRALASPAPGHSRTWAVSPPAGAAVASVVPTIIALIGVAPALGATLIAPYQVLAAPWQGPPAVLTTPAAAGATSVIATLLLTLAAALAAAGFGGAVTRQAVPVVAPGLAVTILLSPAALGMPWPSSTLAALAVFAIAVLGVTLTPPPPRGCQARSLRVTRRTVLLIGFVAGGAGLAGGLTEPALTWAALATMLGVGVVMALRGRTEPARLAGWWYAAITAQLLALTTAWLTDMSRPRAAFLLLCVAVLALALAPRLPRFGTPEADRELATVESAGGYLALTVSFLLAVESPPELAALLVGWGAVLGVAAVRPGRSDRSRRVLLWSAAGSEMAAWWILMGLLEIGLLEAYTLPFAVFALLVGVSEARRRPELGSWAGYGPALVAALGPSLVVTLINGTDPLRQVWVLVGGVAAVIIGSRREQRAPLIIGAVVTAAAALHMLSLVGSWLVLVLIGLILLILGANHERHQRDLERLRGAYFRMR